MIHILIFSILIFIIGDKYEYFYDYINIFLMLFILSFMSFISIIYLALRSYAKKVKNLHEKCKNISKGNTFQALEKVNKDELSNILYLVNDVSISIEKFEKTSQVFIANVSHELKTPMTTILGFIDGILDGTIKKDEQEYYLNIISTEVKRLSRLVRSMLNLSRIETGKLKLNLFNFNICEMIFKILLQFEKEIENKNLNIIGLLSTKIIVYADLDLIHQAIYNLIENAIKFSNNNGFIEFSFKKVKNKVYISIKNSGDGIEEQDIPLVFDRFYKTDSSRSINKTGAGLGLYIVKTIIDHHNENIDVKSLKNEYTELTFSLNQRI